jgi:hypothetical protein
MRPALAVGLFIILVGCTSTSPIAVTEPLGEAGKKWAALEESPQAAAYFKGTFDILNFSVIETGEHFYVVNEGSKLRVMGGHAAHGDLDVPISEAQVTRVAHLGADGKLDDADAFVIMRILFSPVARAFLSGSFLTNDIIRRMAGVEDLIHITFWTEGSPETSSVTLRAAGNRWYVTDGLEGKPKRIFRITPPESLEYMRHAYRTRNSVNPAVWVGFVTWYKRWRDEVSVVPAAA